MERILNDIDRAVILAALIGQVCRMYGMNDQRICVFFAQRQHVAEIVEVVVELLHLILPRQMLGIVCGIVALSLTADGVCIQMLAHDVDTADILQLCDALQLGGRNVPTAAAEHFGQRLLFAKLCAGRTKLLGRNVIGQTASEIVNTRNVFVFIERHDTADTHHLSCKGGFLNGVTGQTASVFLTPVIDRLDPMVDEQLVAKLPVVITEFLVAIEVDKQRREIIEDIVAVSRFKFCGHLVAPDRTPAVILRLIGKEAGHCVTEIVGIAALLVFVMGFNKELFGNFEIEGIDIRLIPCLNDDMIFGDTVNGGSDTSQLTVDERINAEHICKGRGISIDLFVFKIGCVVLLVFKQLAARKTGGPAVFVVGPCFHTELACFVDAGIDTVKPFVAEIFGFETAARVHEEAVHAEVVHQTNLTAQFFFLQLVVPAPERDRAVRDGVLLDVK